tara:strand:+ start:506 stop:1483 length:978 start_codon:yes stop_codon:yes gene_type:complete
MKKNNHNILSENKIIHKYLKKLNFNRKASLNFKNDGAYIEIKKNFDLVVTNDAIVENIDFFSLDSPESIAQKIVIYNLSDLSSMGAKPYAYTLTLFLPEYINNSWIIKFTNRLHSLQKKFNFFLLGGDISKSKQLSVSANFFGHVKCKSILTRQNSKINDSIWVSGNLGDSYIGLLIKEKKLNIKKNLHKYYLNKYNFPTHTFLNNHIYKYISSAIDISDGFYGDMLKLLDKKKGAQICTNLIPISAKTKNLINNNYVTLKKILSAGDDYELIFTANQKFDKKIIDQSVKQKIKISKVGRIIKKNGLFINGKKLLNSELSYQHFT